MRRAVIITVSIVFAVALLSRMMTYTVRFTENAVLTTFGKAGEGAIKQDPGLYFKLPEPIQSVTKYDTRARFFPVMSETQQTADSRQLTVESFCTWKVANPLKFFQRFSNAGDRATDHYSEAEKSIWANLRAAMGEISKYRIDQLFTTDAKASKLTELEAKVLAVLKSSTQGGASLSDYGVEVLTVGISRIELPEQTTQAVFASMKEDRARLVKEIESRGDSEAQTITSTADSNARKILQFAEAYASDIRRLGDEEAQTFIAQMNEAPEFAVFLKNVDFIKVALSKRITWIVDTTMPGFELMAPSAVRKTQNGKPPGVGALMGEITPDVATKVGEPATLAGEPAGGGR